MTYLLSSPTIETAHQVNLSDPSGHSFTTDDGGPTYTPCEIKGTCNSSPPPLPVLDIRHGFQDWPSPDLAPITVAGNLSISETCHKSNPVLNIFGLDSSDCSWVPANATGWEKGQLIACQKGEGGCSIDATLNLQEVLTPNGIELRCTAGCDALKKSGIPDWILTAAQVFGTNDEKQVHALAQQQLLGVIYDETQLAALSPQARETVRILREWAKSNGWENGGSGAVEKWGEYDANGTFSWRIQIKTLPGQYPNMNPRSYVPRFDVRLSDRGDYVNPFTGAEGDSSIGTHIPLEKPFE